MAGKGTEIDRSYEELARIMDGVHNNERLSVRFDTCHTHCLLYTSPSPRDTERSRMPSSA
ncbi:hypothetical protein JMUB7552_27170 [Staphylococcus aureus]